MSLDEQKQSEFTPLEEVASNVVSQVTDSREIAEQRLRDLDQNSVIIPGVSPERNIMNTLHSTHGELVRTLAGIHRSLGHLDMLEQYKPAIEATGGRMYNSIEKIAHAEKDKLDALRKQITTRLESIIKTPVGTEIIETAEVENANDKR